MACFPLVANSQRDAHDNVHAPGYVQHGFKPSCKRYTTVRISLIFSKTLSASGMHPLSCSILSKRFTLFINTGRQAGYMPMPVTLWCRCPQATWGLLREPRKPPVHSPAIIIHTIQRYLLRQSLINLSTPLPFIECLSTQNALAGWSPWHNTSYHVILSLPTLVRMILTISL